MIRKIGKVKLNFTFFNDKDKYSDGDKIEEELLEICKKGETENAVYTSDKWPILYHLSDIRENLLEWYPFKENATVLEIGSGCGAMSGLLCRKTSKVTGIELSERRSMINAYKNIDCENLEILVANFEDINIDEKFDYVTLIGVLEYAPTYIKSDNPFEAMLDKVKQYLKPDGKLIIAIENKMGQKYLNGAKEDHVGKAFAGIEDYRYISKVRTFSKPELRNLLENCGFVKNMFYYPVPDYKTPMAVYSDSHVPSVGDVRIWNMNYDQVRHALYSEAIMSDQICRDKMFDYFSNSFLVICNEEDNPVKFACYTNERKKEYQTKTSINKEDNEKFVLKEYLNKQNRDYNIFEKMIESFLILNKEYTNVNYVSPELNGDKCIFEFIEGEAQDTILSKYVHDTEKLVLEIKNAVDKIYKYNEEFTGEFKVTLEYEKIFGEDYPKTKEKALKVTNLDMTFENIIIKDSKAYCIDYEWIFDFPIPIEFVIYRMISIFYSKFNMYFSEKLNKTKLLIEVGVKEINIDVYNKMERKFSEFAFGKNNSMRYLRNYIKPKGMIEIKGF